MQTPRFEDVTAAAARLQGQAQVTPVLVSPLLDEIVNGRVLIKVESLQIVENTRRLGADIVFYDRHTQSREEIGRRLTAERGATLVPSYDDPHIIAGQGTVGLEMAAQVRDQHGTVLDDLLVPCGGGGLVAGCALALADVSPRTRIYCVEPAGYDDTRRSLASGQLELAQQGATSLCDALMAPTPGTLTFAINRRLLSGGWVVNDAQVMDAMAFAWRELKLVVEPGGAVALAAVLSGVFPSQGKTVGIVLSGGNVDVDVHARALNANAIVRRS